MSSRSSRPEVPASTRRLRSASRREEIQRHQSQASTQRRREPSPDKATRRPPRRPVTTRSIAIEQESDVEEEEEHEEEEEEEEEEQVEAAPPPRQATTRRQQVLAPRSAGPSSPTLPLPRLEEPRPPSPQRRPPQQPPPRPPIQQSVPPLYQVTLSQPTRRPAQQQQQQQRPAEVRPAPPERHVVTLSSSVVTPPRQITQGFTRHPPSPARLNAATSSSDSVVALNSEDARVRREEEARARARVRAQVPEPPTQPRPRTGLRPAAIFTDDVQIVDINGVPELRQRPARRPRAIPPQSEELLRLVEPVQPRGNTSFFYYAWRIVAGALIALTIVSILTSLNSPLEDPQNQDVIAIHQPTLDLEKVLSESFESEKLREKLKYLHTRVQYYCAGLYEWDEMQGNLTREGRTRPEDNTLKHPFIYKSAKTEAKMNSLATQCLQMDEHISFLLERPAGRIKSRALEDLVVVSDENVNRLNGIISYIAEKPTRPKDLKLGERFDSRYEKEAQWRSIGAYIMSMDKLKRDATTYSREHRNIEEEKKSGYSLRSKPYHFLPDANWHGWLRLHLGSSLEVAHYWNNVSIAMTDIVPAFDTVETHVLSSCFDGTWINRPLLCPTGKLKGEIQGKKQNVLDWFRAHGEKAQRNAYQIAGALDRIDLQRRAFTEIIVHLSPESTDEWLDGPCETRVGGSLQERGIVDSDWGWLHPNYNATGYQLFSSLPFCASDRLFPNTGSPCHATKGTKLWAEIFEYFNVKEEEKQTQNLGVMSHEFYQQRSLWLKLASIVALSTPASKHQIQRVWSWKRLPWPPVALEPEEEQIMLLKDLSNRIRNAQKEEINAL